MRNSDDKKDDRTAPRAGLVIRRASAKYRRPASGSVSAAPVRTVDATRTPIEIKTHRGLLEQHRDIAARIAAEPDLGVMLLINPVLALERMVVKLTPEIAHHVLHTIQHPKVMRERRDKLEASLLEALGEAPHPTDAAWNVRMLFTLRELPALEIGDHVPAFLPPLGDQLRKGLDALRPAGTRRYPQPRLLSPRSRVGSVPWKESLRRIDLAAPAPALPHAEHAPNAVPLEDLWFYKDLDGVVHDALELGVTQRGGFPFHTPDSFRQILEGRKSNAFRYWIKSVRFKDEQPR